MEIFVCAVGFVNGVAFIARPTEVIETGEVVRVVPHLELLYSGEDSSHCGDS